jgi:CDP-diacylglycerol--glycerol-3-phosphate 3-phosphatidyltransferase
VPNALTAGRLLLAAVFFVMLSFYQYEGRGDPTLLNIAFLIYLVALITDFLDGYLARRWKVEGTFGRIGDPFVDKVLVLGSFIMFAGKNFIIPEQVGEQGGRWTVKTITGVAPWMVVIMLARELLVTSFRGLSEAAGRKFGAVMAGKVKMVLQSATILVILVYVNYFAPNIIEKRVPGWVRRYEPPMRIFRDIMIWVTVVWTVISGMDYVRRLVRPSRLGLAAPSPSSSQTATRAEETHPVERS